MDQEATGRFIAQLRKDKNLTQKELGDKLGISDKTVSKWETGNGMPDVSLLKPLCDILSVNLNELLSGEKLSDESYSGKAEENMMILARDAQDSKKNRKKAGILQFVIGIMVLFIGVWFAIVAMAGYGGLGGYYDAATIIILVFFAAGMLLVAGKIKAIGKSIKMAVENSGGFTEEEKEAAIHNLSFGMFTVLFAGAISILIGGINLLMNIHDLSSLGPCLSVLLISVLYPVFVDAFLYALKERLR